MPHSGVMSLPPAGKSSVSVSAPPDSVPATVPVFCLWHEPHDPSSRFAESRTAEPEIRSPVCVMVHLKVSAPCASLPVPAQVPARFAVDEAAGAGVDVGEAGIVAEPQAREHNSAAAT